MARFLKRAGVGNESAAAQQAAIRDAVETIIEDVTRRGDAAVRELSHRYDNWSPASFRLTQAEIDACLASLPARVVEDIRFAQRQIANFATHQRSALRDLEVETMPERALGSSPRTRTTCRLG